MASVLGLVLNVHLFSTKFPAFCNEGETGDLFESNLAIPLDYIKYKF